MSLSRLVGLVTVLVLGTLLSVWWYLQVPEASLQELAPVADSAEFRPATAQPAGSPRGEPSVPSSPESALLVPSLPSSVAPASSGRWTRRVSSDPIARTARARRAALQGATPAEYIRGVPLSDGPVRSSMAEPGRTTPATKTDPGPSEPRP